MVPEMLGFAVFPHKRVISQRPYSSQNPSNMTAHHREVMSPASSAQPVSRAHLQVCPSSAVKATAWYSALTRGEDRQIQPSLPSVAKPLRSSPKCALCPRQLCPGTGSFPEPCGSVCHWDCASQGGCWGTRAEVCTPNSKTIVAYSARVRQHSSLQILPFQAS